MNKLIQDKTAGQPFCTTNVARRAKHMDVLSEVVRKELPNGWQWTTMEDIADVIGGGTPKSKEKRFFDGGDIPWLTPADLSGYTAKHISKGARNITEAGLNGSSAKLMPAGSVLFTSRAPIGYVAIASNEISTNQGFKSFVLKSKDILPDYVYWWLKGNKQLAESFASGTTFLELSGSKAKKLPIPIAPLEQQKHIVTKIEELFSHIDAGIEALKKAKQLLKQYRQSVLKAAVTGELTKEWREANKAILEPASDVHGSTSAAVAGREGVAQLLERILKERHQKWEEQQLEQFKAKGKMPKGDKWKEKYKKPASLDMEPFAIPDEWRWIALDTLLNNIEAGKSFKCDERPPNEGETGIVKVSAVTWGEFDSYESKTVVDKSKINSNYRIHERDFLFSRANTIELVGACVIVKHINKDLLLSDKILRFVMPEIWKEWVQLCLRTQHGRNEIESLATGNQESMRNIAQGNIRKIRLPLIPEAELAEISNNVAQKMGAIVRLEDDIDEQLIKAEKNKQSILASSFIGELI